MPWCCLLSLSVIYLSTVEFVKKWNNSSEHVQNIQHFEIIFSL